MGGVSIMDGSGAVGDGVGAGDAEKYGICGGMVVNDDIFVVVMEGTKTVLEMEWVVTVNDENVVGCWEDGGDGGGDKGSDGGGKDSDW